MKRSYLVKNVRNKLNLNQYEFSKIMDVDQSLISRWENDKENVTDSKVFDLMFICELESGDEEFTRVLFSTFVKDILRSRNDNKRKDK